MGSISFAQATVLFGIGCFLLGMLCDRTIYAVIQNCLPVNGKKDAGDDAAL